MPDANYRHTALLCLLLGLAGCGGSNDDHSWMQGQWKSDVATTKIANEAFFSEFSSDGVDIYLSMFGEVTWHLDGEQFSAIQPNGVVPPARYSLTQRESNLVLTTANHAILIIPATDKQSFCTKPLLEDSSEAFSDFVECYIKIDSDRE